MKARSTQVLIVLVAGLIAVPALAQSAGELLGKLNSDSGDERLEAARALAPFGAEVIEPLFEMLAGEDSRLGVAARLAIQSVVQHAAGPEGRGHRAPVAEALAAQALADGDTETRTFAVRMLGFVGGDEVVPSLAKLLADPEMHEIARWALVRIPGDAAIEALQEALDFGKPQQAVGILNALAACGSVRTARFGTQALRQADESVRIAGLNLLAAIPDPVGIQPIRSAMAAGSERGKRAAREAYLRLGDTLVEAGQQAAARRIFEDCAESSDDLLRAAGVAGVARAGGRGAVELLLAAVTDESADVRAAARQGLVDLQGLDAAPSIAEAVSGAETETRCLLVWVLGERGGRDGRNPLVLALDDAETQVRVEALRALGKLGDPGAGAVSAMIDAADTESDEELAALEWAVNRFPEPYVTGVLEKALAGADSRMKPVLLRALGNRGDVTATPTLLAALGDRDEAARLAAIEGLGRLGDATATEPLLGVLARAEGREREAAERALSRFRSEEATKQLLAALENGETPDPVRAGVVRALAPREDPALIDAFMAAAKSEADEVCVAGLDALGRLRDERAAPIFLARAEMGSDEVKRAAIRGYLQIAEKQEAKDAKAALSIYQEALELATGEDEQRQAIRGIGRVGSVQSLPLIEPFLGHDRLKSAAAEAAVPLADKLAAAGQTDRAIALYRQAVEATSDRNVVRNAARKLRELGVHLDLAAEKGCITHWWVLGPFPGREKATKTDAIPTDQAVDLTQPVAEGDKELDWKPWPVDDPLGMLDFEVAVARMNDCGAYAYAEVESDQERDILLKIGSDDSVFVWLNGEQVHAWDGNRGWGPDQDTVEARLKQGTNTILAKVINGAAQWSLSLRITDRDGSALKLKQRTE
jgi:HEAT repeat protein